MASLCYFFIALSCTLSPSLASESSCDPTVQGPLSIPVRNVSLQNPVIRRGVALSLGTPPQPMSLAVNAYVILGHVKNVATDS